MKKIVVLVVYLLAIVVFFALSKCLFLGKELDISFLSSQRHNTKDLEFGGGLNAYDWFIVSSNTQRNNLEDDGYVLPEVDFSEFFLIISRYKILKLYRRAWVNPCTGVPDGRPRFDKNTSKEDQYYLYLMPRVWLSQGVG